MSRKETHGRSAERSTNPAGGDGSSRSVERDIAMIAYNTNRDTSDRRASTFVGVDSRAAEPTQIQLVKSSSRLGQHRNPVRRTRESPMLRNGMAEHLADIEGLPVLVRVLVQDVPAEMRSDLVTDADVHSLLSATLEKAIERMRGSPLRRDASSRRPLAIVELISGEVPSARLPAPLTETVLRVGPLELDLIDRTAKRGDRGIDLRPREFRLLKYMMQRSGRLLTRATLLKDVWNYKFVPETNLVDVHMGRLRRKVDGSNEPPMIRNVRGVGFVLSAIPFQQSSSTATQP
jgi:DNA-binding winged helix-turn-helix (wHTH) protein